MAEKTKKIEKKAYAVLQEALFEKDAQGAYKPVELAKEGMTTLKKHATQVTVLCNESTVEDITSLLKKNDIPFDKVVKVEEPFDIIVTGKDNGVHAYTWPGALDDIGWKLKKDPEKKDENAQKKTDMSLEHWFKEQVRSVGCYPEY